MTCYVRDFPYQTRELLPSWFENWRPHENAGNVSEDYEQALREIYRVLKPGGLAMLPVPMVHENTRYEPGADSILKMVVEPGPDFYQSYKAFFDEVQIRLSTDYGDEMHFFLQQTDEHAFPMPLAHQKYADIIPICRKTPI